MFYYWYTKPYRPCLCYHVFHVYHASFFFFLCLSMSLSLLFSPILFFLSTSPSTPLASLSPTSFHPYPFLQLLLSPFPFLFISPHLPLKLSFPCYPTPLPLFSPSSLPPLFLSRISTRFFFDIVGNKVRGEFGVSPRKSRDV